MSSSTFSLSFFFFLYNLNKTLQTPTIPCNCKIESDPPERFRWNSFHLSLAVQ